MRPERPGILLPHPSVGKPQAATRHVGEVWIVQHLTERGHGLVGGQDHGPTLEVAVVDDPVEHVGGVGCVAVVADLVDDEHGGWTNGSSASAVVQESCLLSLRVLSVGTTRR